MAARSMRLCIAFLGLLLVLMGCGSDKSVPNRSTPGTPSGTTTPPPTTNNGTPRGKLVKNLPSHQTMIEGLEYYGITSDVCTQLVIPSAGTYKDKHVVEISAGPCPSGNTLTADSTTKTTMQIEAGWFSFSLKDSGGNYVGTVTSNSWFSSDPADAAELYELCTGDTYEQVCYLDAGNDSKFHGVYLYQ